jgi:hypothetical protein
MKNEQRKLKYYYAGFMLDAAHLLSQKIDLSYRYRYKSRSYIGYKLYQFCSEESIGICCDTGRKRRSCGTVTAFGLTN